MYAFIGGTIGRIPLRKAPQGPGLQDLKLPTDLAAQYVIYSYAKIKRNEMCTKLNEVSKQLT